MPEYIEREAVIDLITRRYENPEICTQEINSIPAADVAPVVRCEKCEYVRAKVNIHTGSRSGSGAACGTKSTSAQTIIVVAESQGRQSHEATGDTGAGCAE